MQGMIREKDDFYQKMFRLSIPIIIQGLLSAAVNSADVIMLNYVGQSSISAVSLAANYSNILFMVYNGLGTGAALLCTQYFGRNNIEAIHIIEGIALRFSIIISALTSVIAGAVGGMIVLAVTPFVLEFATLNDKAMHYLKYMLFINAYYIMGAAVNSVLIAGVFRAGGDTKFGLVCDTIDMWLYAVPLGFIAAFILKLPVMWVYFLLCTDEFAKWPWVIHHYRSGKWAQNITREDVFAEKAVFLNHTDIK